jgi:hypothetical protein
LFDGDRASDTALGNGLHQKLFRTFQSSPRDASLAIFCCRPPHSSRTAPPCPVELMGFAPDLLDANETTWAFGPADRVGSVGKARVTALKQLGG